MIHVHAGMQQDWSRYFSSCLKVKWDIKLCLLWFTAVTIITNSNTDIHIGVYWVQRQAVYSLLGKSKDRDG